MSEVSAISGATGDDLAALTEKAKEMGAATKFSATEAPKLSNIWLWPVGKQMTC